MSIEIWELQHPIVRRHLRNRGQLSCLVDGDVRSKIAESGFELKPTSIHALWRRSLVASLTGRSVMRVSILEDG